MWDKLTGFEEVLELLAACGTDNCVGLGVSFGEGLGGVDAEVEGSSEEEEIEEVVFSGLGIMGSLSGGSVLNVILAAPST